MPTNKNDLAQTLDAINSKQLVKTLSWIVGGAFACIATAYFAYFIEFNHWSFSSKKEIWGQFGDFIGGTVNPILSFLSLLALVFTVILQMRQLENSRDALANSKLELLETREEVKRSIEAQSDMAQAANAQAKYAIISAKLSALQAALSVTSESMIQIQQAPIVPGTDKYEGYDTLAQRKEMIEQEILRITEQLLEG